MTCKCGAQFCYTCGARWRTCSCTETDEINRQAELRRRRDEQERARFAEASEIALIIAQVEEMERRDAGERRVEEERRAEAQRREEAELARLEELRLREEEARRVEEAQLEQHLREILRLSVEEDCATLKAMWNEVRDTQMQSIDSRHAEVERQHNHAQEEAMARQMEDNEEIFVQMEEKFQKRVATKEQKHRAGLAAFATEQQDLEDDLFLEIQLHLRGKPDKEARERRLQERFQQQQHERHEELQLNHDHEMKALHATATMEKLGLKLACQGKISGVEHKFRVKWSSLVTGVTGDRAWFDHVSLRRQNMVAAHERLMLEALEADQEPVGLTEEIAMTTGPFLPEAHLQADSIMAQPSVEEASYGLSRESVQEPCKETLSPSSTMSASPDHSLAELVASSQDLLDTLVPLPLSPTSMKRVRPARYDQFETNSAYAWMTGALGDSPTQSLSPPQGLSRSRAISRRGGPLSRPLKELGTLQSPEPRMSTVRHSLLEAPPEFLETESGARPMTHAVPRLRMPQPPIQEDPHQTSHETRQDRVLGGLVSITSTPEDKRPNLINVSTPRSHAPSVSSSSSHSAPRTTSSALWIPSTPPSRTNRSSGDSLFLHSLITAATHTATATGRPLSSTLSLSPVSPISSSSRPVSREFGETEVERKARPVKSVWGIFREVGSRV